MAVRTFHRGNISLIPNLRRNSNVIVDINHCQHSMSAPVLMSRQRRAGCFCTGCGGAPTSCDRRRRRQQNGGGGDRRRQRTENTRFSTRFKETQSCEAMARLFDRNFTAAFHYFYCSCWICNCKRSDVVNNCTYFYLEIYSSPRQYHA